MIYTQSDIEQRVNGGIQGKIDMLINKENTLNASARELFNKVDLRSALRRANLAPNLFNGIFPYQCPTDLKGYALVDLPAQAKRFDGDWELTTPEQFLRLNGSKKSLCAIDDYNGTRVLLLDSEVDSKSVTVAELDSLTSGGGTWEAFSADSDSVATDNSDFIKGAGSLKWNITASGGTTAGLKNDGLNTLDITNYLGGTSAFFVWVKINSTTNLTNWILRFGTDSSNYYSKTITAQADGTAFVNGWNLLKFDISSLTETGTVTDTTINYTALYMTKTAGKISESDYKFDWLVLKKGVVNYVKYYSKYPWQTSAGSYLENSTNTTDLLNADTDEFELLVKQGIVNARRELAFPEGEIKSAEDDLKDAKKEYEMNNPSMSKVMVTDYYVY